MRKALIYQLDGCLFWGYGCKHEKRHCVEYHTTEYDTPQAFIFDFYIVVVYFIEWRYKINSRVR